MNSLQAKVLALIFLPGGLILLGYGLYQTYLIWDHNRELSESDNALGGLLSTVSNALGTDMTLSYQTPAILAVAGLVIATLGWLALGKVTR